MKLFNSLHAFIWESMAANNCNTYLIEAPFPILIDPGHLHLFEHVEKKLTELGLTPRDIGLVICTHAHPDHMESVQRFKETDALIAICEKDWQLAKSRAKYLNAASRTMVDSFSPDFFLKEGGLSVKGHKLHVFHTPGHSPGSISIYWPQEKALFTGDLIFKESVGRTDLPGGDGQTLKKSIKSLEELDVEWLLPGHGDIISGAKEVKNNFTFLEQAVFNYI